MNCLLCDEPIAGPTVIRLIQGGIYEMKWGPKFVPTEFEDGEEEKFLHPRCAAKQDVFPNVLVHTHCHLCNNIFEPEGKGLPGESVIAVERGILVPGEKGAFKYQMMFKPQQGGYVHYICACDDWRLPLMDLIYQAAI